MKGRFLPGSWIPPGSITVGDPARGPHLRWRSVSMPPPIGRLWGDTQSGVQVPWRHGMFFFLLSTYIGFSYGEKLYYTIVTVTSRSNKLLVSIRVALSLWPMSTLVEDWGGSAQKMWWFFATSKAAPPLNSSGVKKYAVDIIAIII